MKQKLCDLMGCHVINYFVFCVNRVTTYISALKGVQKKHNILTSYIFVYLPNSYYTIYIHNYTHFRCKYNLALGISKYLFSSFMFPFHTLKFNNINTGWHHCQSTYRVTSNSTNRKDKKLSIIIGTQNII